MAKHQTNFRGLLFICIIVTFHILSQKCCRGKLWKDVRPCIYPCCVWVLRHHEHEVEVDKVCAAADADDAALQVCLCLSDGLEWWQDLGVLRETRSRQAKRDEDRNRQRNILKQSVCAVQMSNNVWNLESEKKWKKNLGRFFFAYSGIVAVNDQWQGNTMWEELRGVLKCLLLLWKKP